MSPGSIFNHSSTPNVSFTLDRATKTISYTLTKDVSPQDELCIFYGTHARFGGGEVDFESEEEETLVDGWSALSSLNGLLEPSKEMMAEVATEVLDSDPSEVVPFAQCPCMKVSGELSLADLPLELGARIGMHLLRSCAEVACSRCLGGRCLGQRRSCSVRVSLPLLGLPTP
jgi:hypothetical protein